METKHNEFIEDFTMEELEQIVKVALEEGYSVKLTEWMDKWEREEGCPSISYELDKEDIYDEDGGLNLPEETKHGCAEWNFVKDNEYICGYHVDIDGEYVCSEAFIEFLGYDPSLTEFLFTSEANIFEIIYHAKKTEKGYSISWEVMTEVLTVNYTEEEVRKNLLNGKFKQITEEKDDL